MIKRRINRNGQVTIPKPLRKEFMLETGDYVSVKQYKWFIIVKPMPNKLKPKFKQEERQIERVMDIVFKQKCPLCEE